MKRNALLLLTGHSLTLLIENNVVAGGRNRKSVNALKRYITARKGTLTFTEDNVRTFPWLRDVI